MNNRWHVWHYKNNLAWRYRKECYARANEDAIQESEYERLTAVIDRQHNERTHAPYNRIDTIGRIPTASLDALENPSTNEIINHYIHRGVTPK